MRAEVPRWHRAGVPDRRELPAISGGAGTVLRPVPWCLAAPDPGVAGPAAPGLWPRRRGQPRQEGSSPSSGTAVALDQAADDARGIKHALDTDRRGQPGSARPCSVTSGHRSLPCTAWSARSRTRPCERPGSSTVVRLSGRAGLTLPMLLPPRARLWDPLAAAAPGSAILCARASHGPLRRCRCRRALGAPRTRLP